ncbi:DUF4883 family protein [Clostridium sp.]|uniref:DUF4883 family protein n=1 Tax=Clostridium sp. TaxID=1506 RepID=UPI003216BDA8
MNKKLILVIILFILATCTGCTNIKNVLNSDKPQINYYTNELIKSISTNAPTNISVFYREFFKEFDFPPAEGEDILEFINLLDDSYFIAKPSDLPNTYKYKVYIECSDAKYALTVFDEKYISIYSWDGKYQVDYVNITKVPLSYNIYGICKYFTEE